jgi:phage-related protein
MIEYLSSIKYCCVYFRTINDKKSNHFSLLLFRYLIQKLRFNCIDYADLKSLESVNLRNIRNYIYENSIELIEPAHLRIISTDVATIKEQFLLSYIVHHFQKKSEYSL